MDEFELIKKFFKPLTKSSQAAQNLEDDVAIISLNNQEDLAISKDIFVEDVHFLLSDGGFNIASKLLRTNISDLASAGAKPLYYMIGFSKNSHCDEKFMRQFARGLHSTQNEFGMCLIGGDTVKSEKLSFSVTIFGSVKKGKSLKRKNAQAGDLIFVSGSIGDAFLGLINKNHEYRLPKADKDFFYQRHFLPTPRINLGQELIKEKLSSCAIDISDGLLADIRHICTSSKLTAKIDLEKIPLSKQAKKFLTINPQINIFDLVSGGDDYELAFTSNPKNQNKILSLSKSLDLNLTCIGKMEISTKNISSLEIYDKNNKKIKIKKFGYEH